MSIADTKEIAKIVINLNDESDAYEVSDPKYIIHMNELNQINRMLQQSVKTAEEYEKTPPTLNRKHDTIMLAGVRGSGKTTFMLSFMHFIKNEIDGTAPITFKFKGKDKIEVLNIFDPTLIEDKVHVFINIISMIKDRVDRKAKKTNCFDKSESDNAHEYEKWEASFKRLAEGLPAIKGVGHDGFSGDEWLDSEFVMNKGVGRAYAANHLEKYFHDFVRNSLKFLGKAAFLLCFDDIDTNFGKGWPVLEVLHKYLTTPQFITIVSGDPDLYSILIRDQQWGNFSDKLLKMEAVAVEDVKFYKETVAHLEEQYFLKLLKPERRVFLNSLYRKEQQGDDYPIIVIGNVEMPLKDWFKQMMETFGVYSGGQQYTFYRFLASTPLRTQKLLLCAFDSSRSGSDTVFGNKIIEIFWSDLAEKKVDVSNLRNVPHYTVPQIIDYLMRNKILIEGYTLTPIFSDHFINSAQFALGTLVTERIKKDPSQIFEYWLRVCLTRELGALMEAGSEVKGKGPTLEDFVSYCAVNKLRTPRYVSRFATAYIRAYLGHQLGSQKLTESKVSYATRSWHGTLPLYGFAAKHDRIDYVLDGADYFTKVMGYLPLSGATNHKGESLPVYSFYNLLGVLGEIVLVARSTDTEDNAGREVARAIIKNSQFREYPLPGWALALSPGDDQVTEINEGLQPVSAEEIELIPPEFTADIVRWARTVDDDFIVSPAILGKAFTRFFYTTNNMDKELVTERSLGEWMHRMVVVFLHSVLLVEAMEKLNMNEVKLNLKNPVSKDNIFIENLVKINKSADNRRLILSKWILACPIWKVYLKANFDCSETVINAESEFLTFISKCKVKTADGEQQIIVKNGEIPTVEATGEAAIEATGEVSTDGTGGKVSLDVRLSPFKLIELLNKNIKIRVKKPKSTLPSFSVVDKEHIEYLKGYFTSKNITIDKIRGMKEEALTAFLKEKLSAKFNEDRINKATAKAIIARIKGETLKW